MGESEWQHASWVSTLGKWAWIAIIVFDIIGLILISIFFSPSFIIPDSFNILYATPFLIVAIICGYIGSKWRDYTQNVAKLGIALGIILFFISIWPILSIILVFLVMGAMG